MELAHNYSCMSCHTHTIGQQARIRTLLAHFLKLILIRTAVLQGALVKGLEISFQSTLSWNDTAAVGTLANKQDRAFEDDAGALKYGAPLVYQGLPTG